MRAIELAFPSVWEIYPKRYEDIRGEFLEGFNREKLIELTGFSFEIAQMNISTSRKGTIRGIHYAEMPPGQAKYVQCLSGSALDIVVDLRPDSENYGKWISIEISPSKRNALLIPSGFGHSFQALEENTQIVYLCSTPFNPNKEHGINPLDPILAIDWPIDVKVISEKDSAAPLFGSHKPVY